MAAAQDRAAILGLLSSGRMVDAVGEAQRQVQAAPDGKRQEAWRLLAWTCLAASDVECAYQALDPFDAWLKAQPAGSIAPSTYGHELALWSFRQTAIGYGQSVTSAVGETFPQGAADPLAEPVLYADLELMAATRARALQDFDRAREHLDRALAATLTLDGEGASFDAARLIVRIVIQLLSDYDTERALRLFAAAEPILKRIPAGSYLRCEWLQARAYIAGFARNHSQLAADLRQLLACLDKVQLKPWLAAVTKASAYNDLLGAETLRGDARAIREVLQAHPVFLAKQAILARGHFADRNEFMFGLAEELAQLALGDGEPTGWQPLLAQPPRWPADLERLREIAAFGEAARGLHLLRTGKTQEARTVLIAAAKARLHHLQDFHRQSRDASPLIYWTEQGLLEYALAATFAQGEPDPGLVLEANVLLARSLSSAPDDALATQAVQESAERRGVVQALVTATNRRRDWEKQALARLAARLQSANAAERPQVWQEANRRIAGIERLRTALIADGAAGPDTVATLAAVQAALAPAEALILYVPVLGRIGRLCVRADRVVASIGAVDGKAIATDARLLRAALTAEHAASDEADSQYPVAAAIRLHRHLFDGLDGCLQASPRVYLMLPEGPLDGLPPAALLGEEPPRRQGGYDLGAAKWLAREHAFVRTTSVGAFVAAKRLASTRRATLDYLGVGDPVLAERATPGEAGGATRGQRLVRGSLGTAAGELRTLEELPETSEEIAAVGGLFDPTAARLLRRDGAGERNFRLQPLSEFDVLHFATHGLVREELAGLPEPALVLTPGRESDPLDDGLLTASEIAALPLRARLAILSACNTARYDARVIDGGIQGLSAAFAIAGVPTLMASLWPIDSQIAKTLVADTVRRARGADRATIADALAAAMRHHLANAPTRAALHPRFWAALVVLGDGSVTIGAGERREPRDLGAFAAVDPASQGGLQALAGFGADWIAATPTAVERRRADGGRKWAIDGGARQIAVAGEAIFAAGTALRRLDADGKILWSFDPDKDGEALGLVASDKGAVVLLERALVAVDADGKRRERQPTTPAATGLLGRYEQTLLAASNIAGNRSVELAVGPIADLKALKRQRIEGFQVHDAIAGPKGWLLVGDAWRGSERRAAAYFLANDLTFRPVWRDEAPYATSARAVRQVGKTFEIASHAERAAGEIVLITLGPDGYEVRRDSIGAGLDLEPRGLATSSAATVLYGAIGQGALWLAR